MVLLDRETFQEAKIQKNQPSSLEEDKPTSPEHRLLQG